MKTLKLITILLFTLIIASCSKDDDFVTPNNNPGGDPPAESLALGWSGEDDISTVPFTTNFGFGNGNIPSSYDITDKFPPIGDQGQYGTCVSWSVGYNAKTAVSGIQKNLSQSDLMLPQNQFSPKDLFYSIPDQDKGANCNGTQFSHALTVLQDRGIATNSTVPYENMGDCSNANADPSWDTEAANYKINYWRKVPGDVILGAKLADNFMSWNSDDVITSHSSFTQVGIHAYHALVIAGYDDSKGPNGAFRVINSWGDTWGDRGYIWIDYNFLIQEFGVNWNGENSLFIMANQDGEITPPNDDNDPTPQANGVDMAPWIFEDYSTTYYTGYDNTREVDFNIYNIGSTAARASDNWGVYYIYFNAYDSDDYGVLFYDQFNTSIDVNTFECPTDDNCIINLDIPGGSDFATEGFGYESLYRSYTVPQITGDYYLVMIADGDDVFAEQDEQNNFFYPSLDPIYFYNGYAFNEEGSNSSFKFDNTTSSRSQSALTQDYSDASKGSFKNAYTTDEIKAKLKQEFNNGGFEQRLNEYKITNKNGNLYRAK